MDMTSRLLSVALALLLAIGTPLHAADNRNDGNTHDTREGPEQPEDEDTEGNDDDDCHSSSPVLIHNREFIWSDTDVVLNGRPTIALSRYYRSYDSREGLFGKGWSTRCEKVLVRVLDYESSDPDDPTAASVPRLKYVHRLANGRRYEFVETAPDVFASPSGLPGKRLTVEEGGAPTLRNVDGSLERYDASGALVAELDRNGNAVNYEYESGALARIADTNGRFLALARDSTGHVASVTDHTGREWRYAYNDDGSLASVTDPAGGVHRYEYEQRTRAASDQPYPMITRVVDASGKTVIGVSYDLEGKVESYGVGENVYTYSVSRGFTYKTDALGARWSYVVDERGHKTEVLPPINRGTPERYEYDADGNVVLYADLAGTEFTQEIDALGRVTSATTPDGTSTIDYVEGRSWPLGLISPSGRETRLEFDASGNPLRVFDPAGNVTTMRWSDAGDLLAVTDPLGNTATSTVDERGLTTSVTDALGRRTALSYDARGNLETLTDAAGNVTRFAYDVLDRRTSATDALGQTTAFAYDEAGRLLSVTDAAGGLTAFAHDEFGRRTSETRPDGSEILYAHRADNLLESMTDPRGVVTSYTYDRGRRLIGVTAGSDSYSYTYDTLGRVTRARSRAVTVDFEYDSMHRPLVETQGRTPVQYAYNVEGELVSMTSLGEERLYGYDERGLLASMTTPSGVHRYEHDAAGQLVRHTLPGGASALMRYDAVGQLLEQDYSLVSGDVLGYDWDELGRVAQITGDGAADWLYRYDAIGRLTSADHERSYSYQYDALGNRLESGEVYDAFNKLLENEDFLFSYDEAGGLASRVAKGSGEETRYGWDGLRRLASVERAPSAGASAESSVTFGYDAFGRRVSKSVGRETVAFRWAGSDLIAEFSGTTSPSAVYRYDGGYAAAEYTDGNGTYFVQSDYLDTPESLVGTDGTRHAVDRTGPYGALVAPASMDPVFNQRFPGQYFDRETGLSYNRFRYYDPELGRYIKDDPIGTSGGPNEYTYSEATPTNSIDPSGLVVETGLDILSVFLSARQLIQCPSWANAGWLAADVVGAAIPLLPSAGTIRHGGRAILALPPPQPSWTGQVINYRHGAMSPIEHIFYRHGPSTGFSNVGRFSNGTGARQVRDMVSEAANRGERTWRADGRSSIVHDFGRTIGTHRDGSAATRLQVHLNEAGEVMTAFPMR